MKKRFVLFFLACYVFVALGIAAVVCCLIAAGEEGSIDFPKLLIELDLFVAFVVCVFILLPTRILRRWW
jgi:hypothetical protein